MRLPARLSLRLRLTLSRFWLLTEMGFGPALTKESCRLRLMAASSAGPVVMSTSSQSRSEKAAKRLFLEDEMKLSRGGVQMEMGLEVGGAANAP